MKYISICSGIEAASTAWHGYRIHLATHRDTK